MRLYYKKIVGLINNPPRNPNLLRIIIMLYKRPFGLL